MLVHSREVPLSFCQKTREAPNWDQEPIVIQRNRMGGVFWRAARVSHIGTIGRFFYCVSVSKNGIGLAFR